MDEREKAFKVVSCLRDHFWSAVTNKIEGGLEYGPSIETRPSIPGSKLFVFENYRSAYIFMSHQWCLTEACAQIWECFVENPIPIKDVSSSSSFEESTFEKFHKFWDFMTPYLISGDDPPGVGRPAPMGTLVVDSVRLVEKVWPE